MSVNVKSNATNQRKLNCSVLYFAAKHRRADGNHVEVESGGQVYRGSDHARWDDTPTGHPSRGRRNQGNQRDLSRQPEH